MKIEWLVTDVTTIGSPDRAERAILGLILAWRVFAQFRTYLWWESPFVMQKPPLELWELYSGSFDENRVVGSRCTSYRIPWQSGTCYFRGDFGLACFLPMQDIFVVAEPLCDVGASS